MDFRHLLDRIRERSAYLIETRLKSPSGVVSKECSLCGSNEIELYSRKLLELRVPTPAEAKPFEDQLRRRDNGRCLSCGLEQSFYKFSEEGRKAIYGLGLDTVSRNDDLKQYPPSTEWRAMMFDTNYRKRLERWDKFFEQKGINRFKNVLHLRCQYGEALKHIKEKYGAQCWGLEMTKSCERYICEYVPEVRYAKGDLAGLIELDADNATFDLIVCTHTLTHSVDVAKDLITLRGLLADGGCVIFCDEISKKFHNAFHMVHMDEQQFVSILGEYFAAVDRIDDCGVRHKFNSKYTLKGDTPDIVAWA